MDYGPMIAFHVEKDADITVGVVQVPVGNAHQFGVMTVDDSQRIVRFSEKPLRPEPMPGRSDVALASMGIYVFSREFLKERLLAEANDPRSGHDFGKNVIPGTISAGRVFAYPFEDVKTEAQAYWRDVGTVDAFYEANMELVYVTPELNLYDEDWPIWTYQEHVPAAKFVLDEDGRRGEAVNSLVAGGCIISGAHIRESLLFVSTHVEERSEVYRSVLLPNVRIGRNCRISKAILDEGCVVPDGTRIGDDVAADAARFHVTERGVVLVTPDMLTAAPAVARPASGPRTLQDARGTG
jgi:glucose-1-phosphate adenylyltransferase